MRKNDLGTDWTMCWAVLGKKVWIIRLGRVRKELLSAQLRGTVCCGEPLKRWLDWGRRNAEEVGVTFRQRGEEEVGVTFRQRGVLYRSPMNPENPPPYPGPGPTAPYPPYPPQPMGPGPMGGPYPPPQGYPYQGYPQYGWQGGPQEPPKTTVYVVERERKTDSGCQAVLAACWTALCCCCLLDNLD
ncbi:cysteine-rich and transmembrane domain-containing protein 1 isoform X2 [Sapajus apella]|uniref:Cysteine-rich and transmembrane domain-containing protein 1 n=2 Tax=Sapajus apella TaxID=9515 RepID=A0A6J3FKU9_SAPAP|nr:cysteine-rich and transmembrane domain-containing protein 1 isoform X2 [Sapajus apella]